MLQEDFDVDISIDMIKVNAYAYQMQSLNTLCRSQNAKNHHILKQVREGGMWKSIQRSVRVGVSRLTMIGQHR